MTVCQRDSGLARKKERKEGESEALSSSLSHLTGLGKWYSVHLEELPVCSLLVTEPLTHLLVDC